MNYYISIIPRVVTLIKISLILFLPLKRKAIRKIITKMIYNFIIKTH